MFNRHNPDWLQIIAIVILITLLSAGLLGYGPTEPRPYVDDDGRYENVYRGR